MYKIVLSFFLLASTLFSGVTVASAQQLYVEYFRDNLFLGLAYHRVGCLTNGDTIVSNTDYHGFSNTRYCFTGESSARSASFYDSNPTTEGRLNQCGEQTNRRYGTPNYSARSNTCNYNIFRDCNSDCWIREFSQCQGKAVDIRSPCR